MTQGIREQQHGVQPGQRTLLPFRADRASGEPDDWNGRSSVPDRHVQQFDRHGRRLGALPGAPDPVIVSTYYGGYSVPTGASLTVYDGGIAWPNSVSFATYASFPWVMLVDGTTYEIYGPGSVDHYGGPYITYHYDANGISQKSSTNSSLLYAISNPTKTSLPMRPWAHCSI